MYGQFMMHGQKIIELCSCCVCLIVS